MIIGIDDSGQFTKNDEGYSFFVSVLVDQNQHNRGIKEGQFLSWEKTIPEEFKKNGEVKGQLLKENHLEDFYRQILITKPVPIYCVVRVKPQENTEELLFKHRDIEVHSIADVVKLEQERGFEKRAKFFNELKVWYNNLNYHKLLKLRCIEYIVAMSFHEAIKLAQFYYLRDMGDESNFNIKINLDKEFINGNQPRSYFDNWYHKFWEDYTKSNRLSIVESNDKFQNPIDKYFPLKENQLIAKDVFTKNTNFCDSKNHFEIRMADAIGIIVNRWSNQMTCANIGHDIISQIHSKPSRYTHLILNEV